MDDVKGGLLPMDLVREARRSEMEGFVQRRVYEPDGNVSKMAARSSECAGLVWQRTMV